MPLSMGKVGETRKIISFHGDENLKSRLLAMGFIVGNEVSIVEFTPMGLIVEVKKTRIALNMGLAHQILVA